MALRIESDARAIPYDETRKVDRWCRRQQVRAAVAFLL